MKVLSVVGARPNFVKMFPLINTILEAGYEHILVHTGQHYDVNMSDIFFQELNAKKADYNLGVGSGTHGKQTSEMLEKIEQVYFKEKPDVVVVPGDTNTTIAGSLGASKLHIPIAHLEAGLRSYDKKMPEEINRILTDHCSDMLFCPTATAVQNLEKEGITDNVHKVGDTMFEIGSMFKERIENLQVSAVKKLPDEYILCTVHRAENTTDEKLPKIFKEIGKLDLPVIIPMHPRTKQKLIDMGLFDDVKKKMKVIDPLGFLEFSKLLLDAKLVLTDSGGVQKEAYWSKTPCVTMRDTTEWVETIRAGGNILATPDDIQDKVELMLSKHVSFDSSIYGYSDTSKRILKIIENYHNKK